MTKSQVLKQINSKNGNLYKVTFQKETNGKTRVMKFTTEDMNDSHIPGALSVQEVTKSGDKQWRAFKYKNVIEIEPVATKATAKSAAKATVKSAAPAKRGRPITRY